MSINNPRPPRRTNDQVIEAFLRQQSAAAGALVSDWSVMVNHFILTTFGLRNTFPMMEARQSSFMTTPPEEMPIKAKQHQVMSARLSKECHVPT